MDTKKEAKNYLDKYFKSQYFNETDLEYKSLVRLLNKAQKAVKNNAVLPLVSNAKRTVCDCEKQAGSFDLKTNEITCWNCGKTRKAN